MTHFRNLDPYLIFLFLFWDVNAISLCLIILKRFFYSKLHYYLTLKTHTYCIKTNQNNWVSN